MQFAFQTCVLSLLYANMASSMLIGKLIQLKEMIFCTKHKGCSGEREHISFFQKDTSTKKKLHFIFDVTTAVASLLNTVPKRDANPCFYIP